MYIVLVAHRPADVGCRFMQWNWPNSWIDKRKTVAALL